MHSLGRCFAPALEVIGYTTREEVKQITYETIWTFTLIPTFSQIFYNMADPGAKFLTLSNFMEFLPEDKAAKAFALFEVSDQGQISKKALMKWVVSVYKERKALSLTLSDNRTVVAKLHRVLDVVCTPTHQPPILCTCEFLQCSLDHQLGEFHI